MAAAKLICEEAYDAFIAGFVAEAAEAAKDVSLSAEFLAQQEEERLRSAHNAAEGLGRRSSLSRRGSQRPPRAGRDAPAPPAWPTRPFRGSRSQTREQTPRKLNPTRTITNVERCPIARSAPHRNRDSAQLAPRRPKTPLAPPQDERRSPGTAHPAPPTAATHAEDRMIMIGSLLSSVMALVAVVLAVGSHLPPFPTCA